MEVTIKTRKVAADGHAETDSVKVVTEAPKHDVYVLEQEIHGLKQTLEINPAQDYAHLDQRLQFTVRQVKNAVQLCLQYDQRAMDSGTVSDHSQLPLVYKLA